MLYCTNCGEPIEGVVIYCPNCGTNVASVGTSKETDLASQTETEYVHSRNSGQNSELHSNTKSTSMPPKTSVISPRRRTRPGKAIFIGVLLLVMVSGVSSVVFSQSFELQDDRTYNFTTDNVFSDINFLLDIGSGNVIVQYNATPMDQYVTIDAAFDMIVRSTKEPTLESLYEIQFETESNNVQFTIHQKDWFHWTWRDESQIIVILRNDIDYNLHLETGSGNIEMSAPEETNFENILVDTGSGHINLNFLGNHTISREFTVESSSGSVEINLQNTTIGNIARVHTGSGEITLFGQYVEFNDLLSIETGSGHLTLDLHDSVLNADLSAETGSGTMNIEFFSIELNGDTNIEVGSGSVNLGIHNLVVDKNINWNVHTGSGGINIVIEQSQALQGLINGNFETGSGGIEILLDVDPIFIPSSWQCETGSGGISFSLTEWSQYSISDEFLISNNFIGEKGFNMQLDTGSGSINIHD